MNEQKYKLCYVKDNFAYFTTRDLDKQWGDDWNDAPYEHNAGRPYEPCWHNEPGVDKKYKLKDELCRERCCIDDWDEEGNPKWKIKKVAFDGNFEEPCGHSTNSSFSVEKINAGAIAWLIGSDIKSKPVAINAGISIEDFIKKIGLGRGNVYLKYGE